MTFIGKLKKLKRKVDGDFIPFLKMLFYNIICKGYIKLFGKRDKRKLKYKISFCLIFKDEAPFLKEWLDFHLTVGVDHFYLYNNNSDDNFREVLEPYIEQETVTLIEWPEQNSQFKAYKHCFETYRNETNWISFIDADEFMVPKYVNSIGEWLSKYDKYPAVMIHWLIFGTGGQLEHDYSRLVIEQYHTCWDTLYPYGKCFVNTRFEISRFDLWHLHHHTHMKYPLMGIKITLPAINQFDHICCATKTWGHESIEKSSLLCNHYYTKAWDRYHWKMNRTDVLFSDAPRKKMGQFYKMEDKCVSCNYTISKYLIRLKINQGEIKL
ncbi:MAG: glycosyltransferase family 2 protein [Bacteroidaceae bacterium]|nr:glycosyltransferase family 2 protein [Bacteroidaceae bacterium]